MADVRQIDDLEAERLKAEIRLLERRNKTEYPKLVLMVLITLLFVLNLYACL